MIVNTNSESLFLPFAAASDKHTRAWNLNHPDKMIGRFEGFRTFERQAYLYGLGRTAPSTSPCSHNGVTRLVGSCVEHPLGLKVTNAPAGFTWHNYGLADDKVFDSNPVKPGLQATWDGSLPWDKMGALGQSMGLEWAGAWVHFKESPHFQMTFGLQITEAHEIYMTAGGGDAGVKAVWKAIGG